MTFPRTRVLDARETDDRSIKGKSHATVRERDVHSFFHFLSHPLEHPSNSPSTDRTTSLIAAFLCFLFSTGGVN